MKKDLFKKGDIVHYIPSNSYHAYYNKPMDSYAHRISTCNEFFLDEAFTHMEVIDVIHNRETDFDRVFPWTNKSGKTVYITKIDKPNTYGYYFKEDELLLVKSAK